MVESDFKKKLRKELDKCDFFLKDSFRKSLQQRLTLIVKSSNPSELKREAAALEEDVKWKIKMLKRREIIAKKLDEIS